MNRRVFALLCSFIALPLAGQTRSQPQMFLSIFAGAAGGTRLWTVDRQQLLVLNTQGFLNPVYDTVRLSRRIAPGFAAGINAAYFPSPYLGYVGEIALLGLGLEDNCTLVAEDTLFDAQRTNRQLCDNINGRAGAASTVAFYGGIIARANPRGAVVPYARLQAGITSRQSAATGLSGNFIDQTGQTLTRTVYRDDSGHGTNPSVAAALGMMVPVSAGYQFRLELRDHLLREQQITGPASVSSAGVPPTQGRWLHNWALLVHFDIVLEKRRGRRY